MAKHCSSSLCAVLLGQLSFYNNLSWNKTRDNVSKQTRLPPHTTQQNNTCLSIHNYQNSTHVKWALEGIINEARAVKSFLQNKHLFTYGLFLTRINTKLLLKFNLMLNLHMPLCLYGVHNTVFAFWVLPLNNKCLSNRPSCVVTHLFRSSVIFFLLTTNQLSLQGVAKAHYTK